jgi:hypothetical protein
MRIKYDKRAGDASRPRRALTKRLLMLNRTIRIRLDVYGFPAHAGGGQFFRPRKAEHNGDQKYQHESQRDYQAQKPEFSVHRITLSSFRS